MGKGRIRYSTLLLGLCWLVYTSSVVGKVNYSANITRVESFFGVTHDMAGLVSTFYFFAYGAGQIFNGIFCKHYNLKYVVFVGLLLAAISNLAVGLTPNFEIVKYLWLINGISLSVLWPCLIRHLSESLPKKDMARASVTLGTTTAVGTFFIYGASALYAVFAPFQFAFYTATLLLGGSAIVWITCYDKWTKKTKEEGQGKDEMPLPSENAPRQRVKMKTWVFLTVICFCLCAVATNLIKDGLTTWVPSILKESYGFDDSFSILLTLCLPLLTIFGNLFGVTVYKKLKNFILVDVLFFTGAGLFILVIIGALQIQNAIITLICFSLVSFLVGSSNSIITSIFPLQMKGKINSGMIAGVLNGCCYIGSTISSYGLGVVAMHGGWLTVFYLMLGVCIAICVIGGIFMALTAIARKKEKM